MIKYALPGAFEHSDLNFFVLDLYMHNRQYFLDDVCIDVCYGNPQFCVWDGGRIFNNYRQMNSTVVADIIDKYNNYYKIPIRFVFTNCDLQPEHYNNRYCNIITTLANNYKNQIVLFDDGLYDYLSNKYNNMQFISSTTKCIKSPNDAVEELNDDRFRLVCLDYNLNHNIKFLESLTDEQKQKTELLVNAICPPGCQYRKNHYHLNSVSHLQYGKKYQMEYCGIQGQYFDPNNINNKYHLNYSQIKTYNQDIGIEYFKLEGRTWNDLDLLLTYLDYLFKPEYHKLVLSMAYDIICKSFGVY